MFLGGTHAAPPRPFNDAVLDGVDFDVEGGTSEDYVSFVDQIRACAKTLKKTYVSHHPLFYYFGLGRTYTPRRCHITTADLYIGNPAPEDE